MFVSVVKSKQLCSLLSFPFFFLLYSNFEVHVYFFIPYIARFSMAVLYSVVRSLGIFGLFVL